MSNPDIYERVNRHQEAMQQAMSNVDDVLGWLQSEIDGAVMPPERRERFCATVAEIKRLRTALERALGQLEIGDANGALDTLRALNPTGA